jgi:aspartyl-tRNA(Asn)/glutamyl-tRNA(Gln) amidotransferase subunit B
VRRPGAPFGTRREIKNLNSFKFLQQAIDCEVQWQIDLLDDGGTVQQATVLFDPTAQGGRGETRSMRSKEDAHDYRYFPDPDLPPLVIAPDWVERVRADMPELPRAMAQRLQREHGLPAYDAAMMTQSKAFAAFFEATVAACGQPKLAANWLMGEVSRRLNTQGTDLEASAVGPATLGRLIGRIADGTLSNSGARQVFDALWAGGGQDVDALIESLGLHQVSDAGALERIVDEVIAANAKSVEEYRAGKDKAFNALVGQAMKASKGKANPAQLSELLKKKLAVT